MTAKFTPLVLRLLSFKGKSRWAAVVLLQPPLFSLLDMYGQHWLLQQLSTGSRSALQAGCCCCCMKRVWEAHCMKLVTAFLVRPALLQAAGLIYPQPWAPHCSWPRKKSSLQHPPYLPPSSTHSWSVWDLAQEWDSTSSCPNCDLLSRCSYKLQTVTSAIPATSQQLTNYNKSNNISLSATFSQLQQHNLPELSAPQKLHEGQTGWGLFSHPCWPGVEILFYLFKPSLIQIV